jgi:glycosyltransferase involved in cell wall biosynthesis
VTFQANPEPPVNVLAFIETSSPTGPAGNLIVLARALAQTENPAVRIRIATITRSLASNPFLDACRDAGIEVDAIRERRRFDFGVVPQVRDVVRRRRPDIIQTHNIKSHFFVRLCGLYKEFPWIAFNHGYTAENFAVRAYNQVDRWSLRRAHRVVAVCEAFAGRLRRWGVAGERIVVRHNAVSPVPAAPPDEIERLRHTLGIPEGAAVLLAVGRLSPEKAQADLLRAIAVLKRRPAPGFRLVVLGDGPERDKLVGLCTALGISELVIWEGATANMALYYSLADIFILSSHSEGSPNALLEAMMAGLPVIATAVGGVPEIVRSGVTGTLVPAGDTDAMAGRIADMLESETLRRELGGQARAWVTVHHSRQAYMAAILEIYDGVLAAQGRRHPRLSGRAASSAG